MKIAIGADHGGFLLKPGIIEHLKERKLEVLDEGTDSEERCDYPDFAFKVSEDVTGGKADLGILICGTGVGMSIAANKVKGIRCVCCSEPFSARLSRMHNNVNVLAFGARVIGPELAKMIVDEFLDAEFQGGRHEGRVGKILSYEEDHEKE